MANINPSPWEIRQALMDFGVDTNFYKGWDTVGRPWQGPDGSPGLMGGVIHHTANSNAAPGNINGVLGWAVTAYDKPVCNMLIGKAPGESYLLAAGSVYHCGDGGPVPALGIPQRGFLGQTRLFGIEIDDPGVKVGTITDYQIENASKTMAALAQLSGWDIDKSILTHKCYTDGCHGANPNGPSPCIGRKNDTLEGAWATWPGDQTPAPYNALWWREKIKDISVSDTWDGTVPTQSAALKAATEGLKNKAAWRLSCRLYDIGVKKREPAPLGQQEYPLIAMKKYQEQIGIRQDRIDGLPNKTTWLKLFGVNKP